MKNTPTVSTIRTPSSYPASDKRYLHGSLPDPRAVSGNSCKQVKNGECLCVNQCS
jgi:hypothetical protein